MNVREKVLKEALNCVNGEREKQYGSPEDNFRRIADFWGLYLTTLFEDTGVVVELDPKDVAIMMILFKIARSLGDQDKLDNYVDMIGYAACGAEIFEKSEAIDKVSKKKEELGVQLADECKECDYDVKCIGTGVCLKEKEKELLDKKNPYSYAHDKLANYVAIKANEEQVPLDNLKSIDRKFPRELEEFLDQAATDCVANGKQFLDCYKEIDELFKKYTNKNKSINEQKDPYSYAHDKLYNYASIKASEEHVPLDKLKELSNYLDQAVIDCVEKGKRVLDCYKEIDELFAKYKKLSPLQIGSFWRAYNNILTHIIYESSKANVHPFDVVDNLTHHDHAPTDMADLLLVGELGFDDVASYIEDAINKMKAESEGKK